MDFEFDTTTKEYIDRVERFMAEHVLPAEEVLAQQLADNPDVWARQPIIRQLQAKAKEQGLWNLFLPASAHGDEGGAGLTNLQYAPLCEILGRSPKLGPASMNCAAPDTGNMEILREFATEEQKKQWLAPLLDGSIRSAFCMTEPDVASSDATNIATEIRRDGDDYVINGRKWWSTGAMNPEAEIFVVMGKTDPEADRHRQQSMVLVPRNTPGVTVERALTFFGFDDRDHGGHAEVVFRDVRVPVTNILKGEGEGFAIAQARLGPGRIHHCMRAIGIAERALDLARERANGRVAFHKHLSEQGVIREWIAEARIAIEANRLLVLKTAWLMDTVGNRAAHAEIQAIKVAVPRMLETIVDRVIQIYGAAGASQDFPLAEMYTMARALRIADGPDEVHLSALGKAELRRTS